MADRLRPMAAHNNLHALLYQATSAEYVVLCLQAYQLARQALLTRLGTGTFRSPAVILDLDETVLDNSAYQAWLIRAGMNFHEDSSWRRWCDLGVARAVPGAVEFVRFAVNNGVKTLFITSRQNITRAGTARNLAMLGLLTPEELAKEEGDGDPAVTRLFMKGMPMVTVPRPDGTQDYPLGNKFEQRVFCQQVRGHEIILSVGDNLSDYAEYYGQVVTPQGEFVKGVHPTTAARRSAALQDAALFGRDFILIPNSTYGGWLRAYEANRLGAGDELAWTAEQVREGLAEPQDEFVFDGGTKTAQPVGPKFPDRLRVWDGVDTVSARP
jgi:predicted secreted acid phosphatase